MICLLNFEAGYGNKAAIRVDALEIRTGEIMGILGRNGSGKSTLLRALVGILSYRGEALADGKEIKSLSHRERARKIAYLPQQLSLPRMDIQTLAAHGRFARMSFSKVQGEADRAAVKKALEETGLWEERGRCVADLSGGERQRAYLAMVLAQDADYLLLDEPGASLDIAHQIETMDLLRRLADRGKGIVITSHDLPQAAACSDRICLIENGKKTACLSPEELADDTDLLRRAMGVTLVRTEKGIYPYGLEK